MARILLASHHPGLTNSYARVAREFADALRSAGHTVSSVGSDPAVDAADAPYRVEQVAPNALSATAARAAEKSDADLFVTVEAWMFAGLAGRNPTRHHGKSTFTEPRVFRYVRAPR